MRKMLYGALAFALAAVGSAGSKLETTPVRLEADGVTYTFATLPEEVDGPSRLALERWLGFLEESDVAYTAEIRSGGRGVCIYAPEPAVDEDADDDPSPGSTRADRRRKLARKKKAREKAEAERRAREGPPKTPEEARRDHLAGALEAFQARFPDSGRRPRASSVWTRGTLQARDELPVLILVRDREDFLRVLDGVREVNPFITGYVETVKASLISGTFFETPLVGIVIQVPEETDGYMPHHELVRRGLELASFKRFGPLPFFAREGLVWTFEFDEMGTIRTFTGRTEFVGRGDRAYDGWPMARRTLLGEGRGLGLDDDLEALALLRKWRSDDYRDDLAAASYGVMRCLVDQHGDDTAGVLERWANATSEGRGENAEGGGWRILPDFVLSAQDLARGLEGVEILATLRAQDD